MQDPRHNGHSFWTTLPGILTALATLITAVGGILGTLVATGLIGGNGTPASADLPNGQTNPTATAQADRTVITFDPRPTDTPTQATQPPVAPTLPVASNPTEPVAPVDNAARENITGLWIDTGDGQEYDGFQQGNQVSFTTLHPVFGFANLSGIRSGNDMTLLLDTSSLGVVGEVSLTISEDGQEMEGVFESFVDGTSDDVLLVRLPE
ncbi:MAG: hypothetical protein WD208_02850 [Dehalococcoidia bacterium]